MFHPKIGITPHFEFVQFVRNQAFDCFAQLFLEEACVKTNSGEYSLEIVQHFHGGNFVTDRVNIVTGNPTMNIQKEYKTLKWLTEN